MKNTTTPIELKRINVVHVDDDAVFLHCVKAYLERNPAIKVVGQYTSANQLLKELVHHQPFDVLIIDYILPEMNGSELLAHLRNLRIKVPVISFTSHCFPEYTQQLEKEGIRYSLAKNQLKYLETLLMKSAGEAPNSKYKQRKNTELTPDDIEMLILCCNNYSREQMANKLCIGVDAVKVRKSLLAKKLGVTNDSIELLKWAIRNKYFEV